MERKIYIDIAKGIAIMLVVVGHLVQNNLTGSTAKALFDFIYSFHMPLFMFLSGYVASLSIERNLADKTQFLAKKARCLLLPFVSWGGINMLVLHKMSWTSLMDLIMFPDNGLWFLVVLFCIQMAYLASMSVVKKIYPQERSLVCETIVSAVVVGIVFVLNKYNTACSGLYTNYNLYAMFFAGSLVATHYEKWLLHDTVLLVSVVGFIWLVPHFHMWGKNSSLLILAISVFASIVMLHLSKAVEKQVSDGNQLITFGKSSMTIYAVHFYLVQVMNGVKLDVSHYSFLPTFVILLLLAFVVCRVCVAFGQIVSSNKILNTLLLGAKYRK